MNIENSSIFIEIVCSEYPTDFDKVGCDGMYIKEKRFVKGNPVDSLRAQLKTANKEIGNLYQQLEIAVEALKKIRYMVDDNHDIWNDNICEDGQGNCAFDHSECCAKYALSEIEALNQLEG